MQIRKKYKYKYNPTADWIILGSVTHFGLLERRLQEVCEPNQSLHPGDKAWSRYSLPLALSLYLAQHHQHQHFLQSLQLL